MATNIGTGPQDIPLNQFLGQMAFQDTHATSFFRVLASDPATGVVGECYFNSTDSKLKVYNGTAWTDVSSGSNIFRDDPLATNLIFAAPYNNTYTYNNIAPLIKGTGSAVSPTTVSGNVSISTNRSKFYGQSFRSPSTGSDWLIYTLPQTLGTGNFTVEFYVYSENAASDTYFRRFISQGDDVISQIQIGHVFNTNGNATYFGLGNGLQILHHHLVF